MTDPIKDKILTDYKVLIPMIRKVVPNVIAQQIVSVQPMPPMQPLAALNFIVHTSWEKKIAWLPVKVHSKWIWLKTYYVRKRMDYSGPWRNSDGPPTTKEYGTIFDVMATKDNNG